LRQPYRPAKRVEKPDTYTDKKNQPGTPMLLVRVVLAATGSTAQQRRSDPRTKPPVSFAKFIRNQPVAPVFIAQAAIN